MGESVVRAAGLARLDDAHAVVLETDGSFSVIPAVVPGNMTRGASGDAARPNAARGVAASRTCPY